MLIGPTFSRRSLFRLAGLTAARLALPAGLIAPALPVAAEGPETLPARLGGAAAPGPAPDHVVELLRPTDLLSLRFECFNLVLSTTGGPPRLVRKGPGDAFLSVVFPPQAIAERAYLRTSGAGNEAFDSPGSVATRLAGTSRLVFVLPASQSEIPYTPEALLAWTQAGLLPSTAQTARLPDGPPPSSPPFIQEPSNTETAIEAPWHLVLSPNDTAGWVHAAAPVTRAGRTELWHTRLGVRQDTAVDEVDPSTRQVRAIWTTGFDPANRGGAPKDLNPFRMSLTAADRHDIVRLTSDYYGDNTYSQAGGPRPVQVERLMLSSLGAWLDLEGQWNAQGIDLATWRHRAMMGRDSYVRTVRRGFLFPFGHPAALVTVTERKLEALGANGGARAYLEQRKFVIVRQPELSYPAPGQPFGGRELPFRRIRLATLVTPDLDAAGSGFFNQGESAFWIRAGNADVLFHVISEDWDQQRQEFVCPLAFLSESVAQSEGMMARIATTQGADAVRLRRDLQGQRVAYGPSTPGKPGDTAFDTATLTFSASPSHFHGPPRPGSPPRFYPLMAEAQARIKAVEQLTGPPPVGAAAGPAPTAFTLHPTYIASGFDPTQNKGAVFAQLTNKSPVVFAADKAGGVATPNMDVDGLSRLLGPVGGNATAIANGTFDPKVFLKGGAKLLGGIELADLIATISPAAFGDGTGVPKITTRTVYTDDNPLAPPAAVETRLAWQPQIKQAGLPDVFGINPNGQPTTLTLDGTLLTKLADPGSPEFTIVGTLHNFQMRLLGGPDPETFIVLTFDTFKFTATRDKPPDVTVHIGGVDFAGPLAFLNALKQFLGSGNGPGASPARGPGAGRGDAGTYAVAAASGPTLQLTTDPLGIEVGYTLAIPAIGVGVFSLENLAFTARFLLPFLGDPVRLYFAFSSRENPFLIAVSLFAGGGFVGLGLGIDGIQLFEVSLEFGGCLTLALVVAEGSVQAMAGVYMKLQTTPTGEQCELTGYLRLLGVVEVLGIITISVEFYLGLTYKTNPSELWGQARLTVQVEVLFFSKSVSLEVERRFAGGGDSGAPPRGAIAAAGAPSTLTFQDLMTTQQRWDEYCDAFAAFA